MVDLYLGSPIWQVLLGLIILPKYYLVQCIRLHLQSYIYRISGQLHVIERCYIENVYKHWQILFIVLFKEFTWDLLLFWVFKLRWNQLKDHLTEVRSFWTQKIQRQIIFSIYIKRFYSFGTRIGGFFMTHFVIVQNLSENWKLFSFKQTTSNFRASAGSKMSKENIKIDFFAKVVGQV